MSKNKELTNTEALDAVYQFGVKCYKRGYYRAGLEVLAGLGISALMFGVPVLYCKLKEQSKETDDE